jgi:splicing factor 3B subunit 4
MLQAGRIVNVHLPKDRVTQTHQGYGFVEFISEEDAEYAARIMNQVRLYGKPIRVNKVSGIHPPSIHAVLINLIGISG